MTIPLLSSIRGLLRFDRLQTLTGAESAQAQSNLGISAFIQTLLTAADSAAARDTIRAPRRANVGSFDEMEETGIYNVGAASSSAVGFPAHSAVVLHMVFTSDAAYQQWTSVISGITYSRTKTSGTWGPVRIKWDATNLVGTAAQSGGIPTGAVIERGSDATNGEYTRFADGTQWCWLSTSVTNQAIDGMYGTLYNGTRVWTFAAGFLATPAVHCSQFKWGTGAGWGSVSTATATNAILRGFDVTTRAAGTAVLISAMAVGRWF